MNMVVERENIQLLKIFIFFILSEWEFFYGYWGNVGVDVKEMIDENLELYCEIKEFFVVYLVIGYLEMDYIYYFLEKVFINCIFQFE